MSWLKTSICVGSILFLVAVGAVAESTVQIEVMDPSGFGFLDTTPFTGQPGNPAATLGEARLNVVRFATALWAQALASPVPIKVSVRFEARGSRGAALEAGEGGPAAVFVDFPGAPLTGVRYPAALADRLAGFDLGGQEGQDIEIVINSDVDHPPSGSTATPFYYGLDGDPPPGHLNMLTVILHGLAHGLGLSLGTDVDSGSLPADGPNVFDTQLSILGSQPSTFTALSDAERRAGLAAPGTLVWAGALANSRASHLSAGVAGSGELNLLALGSANGASGSHLSADVSPDELMEADYLGGLDLCLTFSMLADLGWPSGASCGAVVAVGPRAGPQIVGATGALSVSQASTAQWHAVVFPAALSKPVVLAQVTSDPGQEPVSIRLRNVAAHGFEFQLQEWSYQDGVRSSETVSWIAFEEGVHSLPGGQTVEAGHTLANDQFSVVSFSTTFAGSPRVLSQAQSTVDGTPVVTRQQNLSTASFEVRLQEEEQANNTGGGGHAMELVGFVAAAPGASATFSAGSISSVSDAWSSHSFGLPLSSNPGFVAQLASYSDPETAGVKVRGLSTNGVEVAVAEETSADSELLHGGERIDYLAFSDQGPVFTEGWMPPTIYFDPAAFDSQDFETDPGT